MLGNILRVSVAVAKWKNRSNAEIAFHNAAKTQFDKLQTLLDAAVSSRFGHILNPFERLLGNNSSSPDGLSKCPRLSAMGLWDGA